MKIRTSILLENFAIILLLGMILSLDYVYLNVDGFCHKLQ